VRSHAKATSVGSNSGPGQSRGSLRRASALTAALCALLAALLLLPAFASAAETRPSIGTLGSFTRPGPVAVDQGTHDVYVADYGSGNKLKRFDESGAPANFSALGTNEIGGFGFFPGEALNEIAVDSASHDFYVAGYFSGVIKAYQQNGEPHEFTAGPGAGSNEIEGFTELCGVAVDSNGDIYMGDYGTGVHVYAPDGEELISFSASEACNVAVDSSGDVYVARYAFGEPGVEKFTPSEFPVTASTTYASAGEVTGAAAYAIAVDPASDDLYVDEGNRVSVYDSSGAPRYEFAAGIAGSEGVAVDDATGRAYAADAGAGTVQVYGPPVPLPDATTEDATDVGLETALLHGTVSAAGAADATCEFQYVTKAQFQSEGFESAETVPCEPAGPFTGESHSAVSGEAIGLTPGTDYRFRLAATSSYGTAYGAVHVFHTMRSAPLIESASVEAVGPDNADLSAAIDPEGGRATYRVEFGASEAYGQSSESATIGFEGDESPHTVSVHVAGLTPGTAYHFRFVATNGAGTTDGEDTSFATYSPPQTFAPCSNDQFRTGFGAELPDCRAYEQATPTDKNGADARGAEGKVEASSSGDRVTFELFSGLPTSGGSSTLSPYIASRGPEGWSSDSVLPLTEPGEEAYAYGWSGDLSRTLVSTTSNALFLRDSATAAFEHVLTAERLGTPDVAGFAADTRHLLFQTHEHLLPEVTGSEAQLYDLDHGRLSYVGRIPAGEETSCDDEGGPACIVSPNATYAGYRSESGGGIPYYVLTAASREQISRDGSRVFFSALGENPGEAKIYLREDGVRTTWVSAPQRSAPDPNGTQPATLWAVTPDGSKAFFTSCEKLTEDSTAVSGSETGCAASHDGNHPYTWGRGLDLYSYDSGSGKLTDLTVDSNAGDALGADVVSVLGASADGSYVYFAANGVLAPGASPGDCYSISGKGRTCNLYVAHGGTVSFLAPLAEAVSGGSSDNGNWEGQSRVSANGTLLFRSLNSLTGYDNVGFELGDCGVIEENGGKLVAKPCPEFYRYVPATEQLNCVTCNPAGLIPKGNGPSLMSNHSTGSGAPVGGAPFLTRNLSANGKRVFFESDDALLPTDTNGNSGCPEVRGNGSCKDVYEWEAKGEGSCESESENGGCLYLISSGKSPDPSFFLDASENGDDVFFFTHQQLVPGDKDQLEDVYDASVGGGLASQHTLTPPTCAGAACVANPPAPPPESLSSSSFSGPGNAKAAPKKRSCPKGKRKVKRRGKVRCLARHRKKRHGRHHGKRHHNKRANVNRGGSK
jgi:hypothetical protein